MAELAIEVNELHFSFPSSNVSVPALQGVDLVLPRGAIAILVGSNGAGELLRMSSWPDHNLISIRYFQANRLFCRFSPESE